MSDATRPIRDPLAPPAEGTPDARGETAVGTTAHGTATGSRPTTATTPGTGTGTGTGTDAGRARPHGSETPLLAREESEELEQRLTQAVTRFVDGPRDAVAEADRVLEEIAARFTEAVTRRRRTLRTTWQNTDDDAGGTADTEQLRLALRDYRELAQRLLDG
ncbi:MULTISPECIES: hypothetical protein [Streptomyces]|uniref:Uncharacterized protein n=2 Tax=Streptomyces TaxID=1883 RepID=A0A2U9P089_STRAS|nr:hypothetical protein [Streptomyces actuosus]AWT42997.1 hypothetical protein DMT42_12130 [Streptomyces actuosus]MBM4824870.1 hypothetical protein [Streptomyces actuosus]